LALHPVAYPACLLPIIPAEDGQLKRFYHRVSYWLFVPLFPHYLSFQDLPQYSIFKMHNFLSGNWLAILTSGIRDIAKKEAIPFPLSSLRA
jgi:hypothetical protein